MLGPNDDAAAEEWKHAFQTLKVLARDAATAAKIIATPGVVALAAAHASLTEEARPWGAESGDAIGLLLNMLITNRDQAGTLLCAAKLGALPRIAGALEAVAQLPMIRSRVLGSVRSHAPPTALLLVACVCALGTFGRLRCPPSARSAPSARSLHAGRLSGSPFPHPPAAHRAPAPLTPRVCVRLAQVLFNVTLHPAAGPHHARLRAASLTALSWLASHIDAPGHDLQVPLAGGLAADLIRALFNLLHASPPDAASESGRAEAMGLLGCVKDLLALDAAGDGRADLAAAQLAALQIPLLIPPEVAYPAISDCGKAVCELLMPLMRDVDREGSTSDEANTVVVPILTLQKLAEHGGDAARDALKAHLFGDMVQNDINPEDPYQPAGMKGWDPNAKLAADASLVLHLIKAMTSVNYLLKRAVADMFYAVCNEDAQEMVRLTGLGSSAGFLQERDMFAAFGHMMQGGD